MTTDAIFFSVNDGDSHHYRALQKALRQAGDTTAICLFPLNGHAGDSYHLGETISLPVGGALMNLKIIDVRHFPVDDIRWFVVVLVMDAIEISPGEFVRYMTGDSSSWAPFGLLRNLVPTGWPSLIRAQLA